MNVAIIYENLLKEDPGIQHKVTAKKNSEIGLQDQ
jgi:hypothetical protein